MNHIQHFISCDWGTTNFRLRLVETHSLNVLYENRTDQGIKRLYEAFLQQKGTDQQEFFYNYLARQIEKIPNTHREHLVVMAGMASSNIGLHELDYAEMPFKQTGEGLVWRLLSPKNELRILLISGVKSESGLVRGEETQAIGLEKHLSQFEEGILLLPGTHSKHMAFKNGRFVALKNFMTGELFEVLSRKSILANSVIASPWNKNAEKAFKNGIEIGFKGELTTSLLSLRAKDVLDGYDKKSGYFFLSGMLIGDELAYLKNQEKKVFLAAPNSVFGLYKVALESILDKHQLVMFDSKALDKAFLRGQKKILELYEN